MLCTLTWKTAASGIQQPDFRKPLTSVSDTTKPRSGIDSLKNRATLIADTATLPGSDTSGIRSRVDTFSLKLSKDTLEAPLKYAAEDSVVILVGTKKVLMYGKTKTEYQDITLTAPQVVVDQQTQVVTAVNKKDSTGLIIETAHFKSGESEFTADSIRYNFKTQVGLTKNTYTTQGEFLVIGETAKKVNANTTFIKEARFTTCLLDDPHFDIKTNKMKVINQKLAVSGPAHLEFEGVPIPIYLPFGFYPLSQGRHSGLLRPTFITDEVRGLGLQGLGYYKVLSEYWDAQLSGDIFSYGEWAAGLRMTYRKRYKYNGGFTLSMRSSKLNFKNDPDFSKTNVFNIAWNHGMDSKARPGVTFSASVNAGSTKYNQLVPGNALIVYNNLLGSSITYSKTWKDKPFNLSLSATHSQNNSLRLITLNLPNAAFTVSTLYPFQAKNSTGTGNWYEKLGIAYNGSFSNNISFYDSLPYGKNGIKPFFRYLLDTAEWRADHSIPITLSLPPILGGRVLVSPGVSYSQTWMQRVTNYVWNPTLNKVDTITSKGIYIDQRGSASLSLNTAIFGTYQFKRSNIVAIRHTIRPTVGFSYTPDLNKSRIKKVQVDADNKELYYNEIGGYFILNNSTRKSASLNFAVDNVLEMKVKAKKDTTESPTRKVKLIEGLGFSGSYDFIKDSLNLSHISINFRTTLFDKININAGTTLDPYQTDKKGYDIAKYAWQGGKFSLGRLVSGNISLGTNFQSKPKDAKKDEERKKQVEQRLNDPSLIADQQRLLQYMQQNPSEFVDFNISWQIGINYSLTFFNQPKADYSGFENKFNSGFNFNGSFNLTDKWKLSGSGSYDFDTKKIEYVTLSINRDMHCWQMSINVIPVGYTRSFNFSISPKAPILQDLKINRTRNFSNY
ncbi:MAG: putative LPS assembly protein LptD [Chitinophagaceae bacterium]